MWPVPGLDIHGHARRTPEGYILAGRFDASNVSRIAEEGVRVILGAVDPGEEAIAELGRHGIEYVAIPIGSTWRHGETIRSVANRYPPEQILIHCEHGVDRTGNIVAHLLVTQHGWPVDAALYAVVYPNDTQVRALTSILSDYGTPGDWPIGIYSLSPLGQAGGMKAAGEGYERLIRGNIEELGRVSGSEMAGLIDVPDVLPHAHRPRPRPRYRRAGTPPNRRRN